jgi:hypothetical protein
MSADAEDEPRSLKVTNIGNISELGRSPEVC